MTRGSIFNILLILGMLSVPFLALPQVQAQDDDQPKLVIDIDNATVWHGEIGRAHV